MSTILPDTGFDPARVRASIDRFRRPYVRLKAAATLDGKIATRDGASQWITGEAARALGRRLRASADGVLVGIGTALADDPRLTVRDGIAGEPARIVLDSAARLPLAARCLAADGARRILVAGSEAPADRMAALRAGGVEIVTAPTPRPQPRDFLPALLRLGLRSLLVEGGARVHASLIAQEAADDLWLFLAGSVMGDSAAPAWCADRADGDVGDRRSAGASGGETRLKRRDLASLPRLKLMPPLILEGGDLLVRGEFERPDSP